MSPLLGCPSVLGDQGEGRKDASIFTNVGRVVFISSMEEKSDDGCCQAKFHACSQNTFYRDCFFQRPRGQIPADSPTKMINIVSGGQGAGTGILRFPIALHLPRNQSPKNLGAHERKARKCPRQKPSRECGVFVRDCSSWHEQSQLRDIDS